MPVVMADACMCCGKHAHTHIHAKIKTPKEKNCKFSKVTREIKSKKKGFL